MALAGFEVFLCGSTKTRRRRICMAKGIKPFPALAPSSIGNHNVHIHASIVHLPSAARGNHATDLFSVHIHASIVHLPGAGEGFMPSFKKCPNRCEKTHLRGKIGRTLFLEGHKALPCTGTTTARGNHATRLYSVHIHTLIAFTQCRPVFIPILAAAWHLLFILSAVGRTGINPIPTADVCNALAINGLSK